MIAGGNWWRANEIVIRHLTRRTATRYRSRDKARETVVICVAFDGMLEFRNELTACPETTIEEKGASRA
jgi:hypothetical protein